MREEVEVLRKCVGGASDGVAEWCTVWPGVGPQHDGDGIRTFPWHTAALHIMCQRLLTATITPSTTAITITHNTSHKYYHQQLSAPPPPQPLPPITITSNHFPMPYAPSVSSPITVTLPQQPGHLNLAYKTPVSSSSTSRCLENRSQLELYQCT